MNKQKTIDLFGSGTRLAEFLGVTPQTIYQWPETIPKAWGYELEARSNGVLKYVPPAGSRQETLVQKDFSTFVLLNKSD